MDDSEIVARNYFTHLGFKKIDYEPEGKSKPPDFLLDDRIAAEVRRLNQNEVSSQPGTKAVGLENGSFALWKTVQNLLPSLGTCSGKASWYVHIEFRRPIPSRRKLEIAIRRHLQGFRDGSTQTSTTTQLFDNVVVELFPAGRLYSNYFLMGGSNDGDTGGMVVPELERNLKICIDEKTAKVSAIRWKYPEWWLVLIDRISYGAEDALQVPSHTWDKIVLINPLDHTQARVL
jgi:hypothetical protein